MVEADFLNYNSDEDVSDKQHDILLKNVAKLDTTQHIKKPTRTGPTLEVSEFGLTKPNSKNSIKLNDFVKVLNTKSSHTEIGKKLNKVRRKTKVLPKPLEKPQQQKIQRNLGFSNLVKSLDKWNAVVTANRAAEQLHFPIPAQKKIKLETTSDLISRFRVKSDLQLKLEALNPPKEKPVPVEKFPLTLEEILERRREAAKLRAQQSYREARARRQNKIKSKKYHRIQRREKVKQQIKEFEMLQKTNPEEALKKLEEIEKARAEERSSLRHRSTGKWAQNKQVRAKYDKESRQALAQQLTVSRDLTEKMKVSDSSDSETEVVELRTTNDSNDKNNPWVNNLKPASEVVDFVSGYRKYWDEKNKSTELQEKFERLQESTTNEAVSDESNNDLEESEKKLVDIENPVNDTTGSQMINGEEVYQVEILPSPKSDNCSSAKIKQANNICIVEKSLPKSPKQRKLVQKRRINSTSEWEVEDISPKKTSKRKNLDNFDIDELFAEYEDKLEDKLHEKVKILKKAVTKPIKEKKLINRKNEKRDAFKDLTLPKQRLRAEIDEPLQEESYRKEPARTSEIPKKLPPTKVNSTTQVESNIDPNTYIKITPKHLNTQLPDVSTTEDALDDDVELQTDMDQQALIAEAFEDDDIVDEFKKDKRNTVKNSQPQDIDLTLPGWGAWGGKNLKKPPNKRMRINFPKKVKRKDDNKGNLILKEHRDKKIRALQVSDVPFPFTSVAAFETTLKAPLGSTFVTEAAHRRLIKPAVVTKMGSIIEPMDEDELLKTSNKSKPKKKPVKTNRNK